MHRWRRSSLAVILLAVLLTTTQGQNLIDLNRFDPASTDGLPLILQAEEEFLLDPANVTFLTPSGLWDNVSVVILAGPGGIVNPTVSLDITGALESGRLISSLDNVTLSGRYSLQPQLSNNQLETILGNSLSEAFVFTPEGSPNATEFADMFIRSVEYDSHSEIDFASRNVCFVVSSGAINTVGCMSVRFVGEDDSRPVIDASQASPATFMEGQTDPVLIFNGAPVTVTDADHPSFLLQSAQAAITVDFSTENPQETLSLAVNFTGITYNFNEAVSATLVITGAATPNVYSQILGNITYYTSMQEPTERNRTIRVEVSDSADPGVSVNSIVVVININDAALVNFGNQSLSIYYEGNGSVLVAPELTIVDPDPIDMVTRVVVVLFPLDGSNEHLSLAVSSPQITVNTISQHRIELTGNAMSSDYDSLLRDLRYEHNDSAPGNPTAGLRTVQLSVTDNRGSEALSTLNFTVQPLNDPPVLTLSSAMVLEYTEDDPVLPLTSSLSLVDVDSNITEAVITLTGLLNGQQDQFTFSQPIPSEELTLVPQVNSVTTRTLTLSGSARPQVMQTLLQSLRYLNTLTNNSVADGNRTVQLRVTDSAGATSNMVTVIVVVEDRNDEPTVMIDDSISFEEGGNSIEIVTQHLVDIMDEEMDNISSINITLSSPNGQLDQKERVFLRTPLIPLLLDADVNRTKITLDAEGTVEQYEEVLKAVRYINQEDEPTCFVSGEERLQRVLTVMITDNNPITPSTVTHIIGISITLINDNAPRLVLRSNCSAVPPVGIFSSSPFTSYKRDTSSLRPHRMLQLKKKAISGQFRPGPVIISAIPSYSVQHCLTNITITFSTDTSTPPVEVQRDLQDVMTFQPSHFNTIPRHGVWVDRRTLLILLDRCYQRTNSSQEMYLMFEDQQGDCSHLTECASGVCYSNKTGCPLIGLVPIPYVLDPITARVETLLSSEGGSVLPYMGIALAAITVALIATIVVVLLLRSKYSRGSHLESDEQKPLTSSDTAPTSYSSIADSLVGESKHDNSNNDAVSKIGGVASDKPSEAVATIIDVTSDTANSKPSDKSTEPVSITSETISDTVNTRQKEEREQEKEEEHTSEGTDATETLTSQQACCVAAGCRSHQHTAPVDVPPHYHQHPHTITHMSGSQTSNPEPHTNRHSPTPTLSVSIDKSD